MQTKPKRDYNSINRKAKAQRSRAKILESAKFLFANQGYPDTSISHIAKKSGVSDQTLYALFKSKLGILRAIMDECYPHSEHAALVKKAEQEKCPKKRLSFAAKIARQIYDAETQEYTLLQGAYVLSPELKQLEQEREKRRYDRLKNTIDILLAEKVINASLNPTQALDIFWAFTGRDIYRLLVIERGWSSQQYEAWLTATLAKTLLNKA